MDIELAVKNLFLKNRRVFLGHQFTVPSSRLYPFQWLWDSCFHALILSHFDLVSAKLELRSVCAHPLPGGLLPHMIFWQAEGVPKLNWGRESRGEFINSLWRTEGTSSITQPPLIAQTLWRLYEIDGDGDLLADIYPVVRTHLACLASERTFAGDHLLYLINPDESGEDNSPRFDTSLHLPATHSADENLDKRMELMNQNALCDFAAKTCMSNFFGVADVSFNVLYVEELRAMARISEVLGKSEAAREYMNESTLVQRDIVEKMRQDKLFLSYDHLKKQPVHVLTWNIFMPLYGGLLTPEEARTLVDTYLWNNTIFKSEFGIVTTAKTEAAYDPQTGFWRGPIWAAPHWFIYQGLKRYGFFKEASEIKEMTKRLILTGGFREHYHPETGAGLGAEDFTWSGLVLDMN